MEVGELPAQLFSPAKMVYIAYVLGITLGKIETSPGQFGIVSLLFLVVEIGHNDYLRIRLNKSAARHSEKKPTRGH